MTADSPDPVASKIMVIWKAQIQRARASANDVPRLLKAVEKVLELHRPETFDGRDADGMEFDSRECVTCDNGGLRDNWPCGTVLAITAALAGNEADNG